MLPRRFRAQREYWKRIQVSVFQMCFSLVLQFIFRFPYRIIFAVATQDSLLFYDSQQLSPFAYVSQIHYLRLTDISWSADGRILIVTSTDGFSTFITFDKEELGTVYTGKLLELNELEPGWNQQRATLMKFGSAEKQKIIKPTICTTPITAFFKKAISPSMKVSKPTSASSTIKPTTESINENDDDDVRIIEPTSQNVNQNKPGRRVSLITLFTPKNSSNGSSTVNESIKLVNNNGAVVDDCKNVNQIETGVKRKRPEEECETPTTTNSSQSSLNLNWIGEYFVNKKSYVGRVLIIIKDNNHKTPKAPLPWSLACH